MLLWHFVCQQAIVFIILSFSRSCIHSSLGLSWLQRSSLVFFVSFVVFPPIVNFLIFATVTATCEYSAWGAKTAGIDGLFSAVYLASFTMITGVSWLRGTVVWAQTQPYTVTSEFISHERTETHACMHTNALSIIQSFTFPWISSSFCLLFTTGGASADD